MTRRVALALAGFWLLIASAAFVGTYLANAASAAQPTRQGDAALGGTGAAVAAGLPEECPTDHASLHGSLASPDPDVPIRRHGVDRHAVAFDLHNRGPIESISEFTPEIRASDLSLASLDDKTNVAGFDHWVVAIAEGVGADIADLVADFEGRGEWVGPDWSIVHYVSCLLRLPTSNVTCLSSAAAASRPSPNGNPAEPPRLLYDGVILPSPAPSARTGAPTPPNADLPPGRLGVGGGAPLFPALLSAGLAGPVATEQGMRPASVETPRTATILRGTATWYCLPGRSPCTAGYPATGAYAAAGPALRAALGDWRGRTVTVTAGGRSVEVTLVDWCRCPSADIDLYAGVFADLAPLDRGRLAVIVTQEDAP